MFDWEGLAGRVASGEAAPLDAVPGLAGLDDEALLGLGQEQALAVIEVSQAALAALAAVQALAVEAFTRREQEEIDRFIEAERSDGRPTCWVKDADETVPVMLAPVFHLAPRTMHSMLFELRTLVNDLPVTFGLARAGRLEASRARTVAGHAGCVDRSYLGDFEEQLHAKDITAMAHAAVRARAAVTALRVDPASARHRGDDARRDREVRVRPGEPGMSEWSASQPAEVSVRAWAAIEALAVQYATANPELNIGQARADAMMDLILAQASIETTIDLVIPYQTSTTTTATTTPTTATAATTNPPTATGTGTVTTGTVPAAATSAPTATGTGMVTTGTVPAATTPTPTSRAPPRRAPTRPARPSARGPPTRATPSLAWTRRGRATRATASLARRRHQG